MAPHKSVLTTTHISSPDFTLGNNVVNSRCDGVGLGLETKVTQHHGGGKDHGGGVGLVGSHNVFTDVSASRLEKGVFSAEIASGNDTWSTNEGYMSASILKNEVG